MFGQLSVFSSAFLIPSNLLVALWCGSLQFYQLCLLIRQRFCLTRGGGVSLSISSIRGGPGPVSSCSPGGKWKQRSLNWGKQTRAGPEGALGEAGPRDSGVVRAPPVRPCLGFLSITSSAQTGFCAWGCCGCSSDPAYLHFQEWRGTTLSTSQVWKKSRIKFW